MKHETICLHGGHQPDSDTLSRAVPIHRTSSFVFKSTEHAANLFALRELGNIYTRLMNPTTEMLAPLAYILRMRTVPLRNLGACISPDNSWQFLQGIETLPLRMERHCENSLAVAKHLKEHPSVEWVRFPGLPEDPEFEKSKKYLRGKGGSVVIFGIKGGAEAGSKFINSLKMFSHVANLGDAKSLAIHPATTTHSQLTSEQQLAGGIEHIDDILADLDQALGQA